MVHKRGTCSEKTKTAMRIVVAAAVVLTFVLFSAVLFINGNNGEGLMTGGVAIIILVLFATFLKREKDRIKAGQPREDEMTQRLKERAGYLTFLFMIWFCLVLSWYADHVAESGGPTLIARHALEIVIGVGAVVFVVIWFILKRRGLR